MLRQGRQPGKPLTIRYAGRKKKFSTTAVAKYDWNAALEAQMTDSEESEWEPTATTTS